MKIIMKIIQHRQDGLHVAGRRVGSDTQKNSLRLLFCGQSINHAPGIYQDSISTRRSKMLIDSPKVPIVIFFWILSTSLVQYSSDSLVPPITSGYPLCTSKARGFYTPFFVSDFETRLQFFRGRGVGKFGPKCSLVITQNDRLFG